MLTTVQKWTHYLVVLAAVTVVGGFFIKYLQPVSAVLVNLYILVVFCLLPDYRKGRTGVLVDVVLIIGVPWALLYPGYVFGPVFDFDWVWMYPGRELLWGIGSVALLLGRVAVRIVDCRKWVVERRERAAREEEEFTW